MSGKREPGKPRRPAEMRKAPEATLENGARSADASQLMPECKGEDERTHRRIERRVPGTLGLEPHHVHREDEVRLGNAHYLVVDVDVTRLALMLHDQATLPALGNDRLLGKRPIPKVQLLVDPFSRHVVAFRFLRVLNPIPDRLSSAEWARRLARARRKAAATAGLTPLDVRSAQVVRGDTSAETAGRSAPVSEKLRVQAAAEKPAKVVAKTPAKAQEKGKAARTSKGIPKKTAGGG